MNSENHEGLTVTCMHTGFMEEEKKAKFSCWKKKIHTKIQIS